MRVMERGLLAVGFALKVSVETEAAQASEMFSRGRHIGLYNFRLQRRSAAGVLCSVLFSLFSLRGAVDGVGNGNSKTERREITVRLTVRQRRSPLLPPYRKVAASLNNKAAF